MRIGLYVLLPTARGACSTSTLAGWLEYRSAWPVMYGYALRDVQMRSTTSRRRMRKLLTDEVVRLAEDAPVDQADHLAAERAVRRGLLLAELPEHDVGARSSPSSMRWMISSGGFWRSSSIVIDVVARGAAQAAEVGVVLAVVAEQVDDAHVRVARRPRAAARPTNRRCCRR